MKNTHTPGPWSVTESITNNECNRLVVKRKTWGGEIVADLGEAQEANFANARLIAAAPDMLDALQRIESSLEHEPELYSDILSVARNAIAKAKGEA